MEHGAGRSADQPPVPALLHHRSRLSDESRRSRLLLLLPHQGLSRVTGEICEVHVSGWRRADGTVVEPQLAVGWAFRFSEPGAPLLFRLQAAGTADWRAGEI